MRVMENAKKKKHSLLWLKITLPIVAGLVLLLGGWFLWKHVTTVVTEKKQQALYSQIQKVAELTVLKYNYSDIASTKKVRKNTNKSTYYSLVKFRATLRIGIPDVSKIMLSFSEDGKIAEVLLPHTEVLENALLSQEVFDDNLDSWQFFSERITTQEIFDTIEMIMKETARENEKQLCRDADAQLAGLVRAMLQSAGLPLGNITITFMPRPILLLQNENLKETGATVEAEPAS